MLVCFPWVCTSEVSNIRPAGQKLGWICKGWNVLVLFCTKTSCKYLPLHYWFHPLQIKLGPWTKTSCTPAARQSFFINNTTFFIIILIHLESHLIVSRCCTAGYFAGDPASSIRPCQLVHWYSLWHHWWLSSCALPGMPESSKAVHMGSKDSAAISRRVRASHAIFACGVRLLLLDSLSLNAVFPRDRGFCGNPSRLWLTGFVFIPLYGLKRAPQSHPNACIITD